jgi:proteasome lid subunit RPN8/RPN11
MTGTPSETGLATWHTSQCPLRIEYAATLLDEVRIAVVDAFFSLPRGGAEIGGILFGTHQEGEVRILTFRPMECEHAMGPTFVLSDKDKARLGKQLEEWRLDPGLHDMQVVGWYHSHTRSEIFLSELDLEIYREFFPERWQVALVLRPAGMKPTRAGFFFRAEDGSVHSSASFREFVLGFAGPVTGATRDRGNGSARAAEVEPAPPASSAATQAPASAAPTEEIPVPQNGNTPVAAESREPSGPPAVPAAEPVPPERETVPARRRVELTTAIEMRPADFVPPAFLVRPEAKRPRKWLWASLLLIASLGAAGFLTSRYWLPLLTPSTNLHLQALDMQGQLRIQWDHASLASKDVQNGSLEILDGKAVTSVPLDKPRILSGSFQYVRRSEMVEVHLTVQTVQGKLEEFTSFIGQPPARRENASDLERERQHSALAAEAARARGDLKKEEMRAIELQQALEKMKQELRRQEERKRAENQLPAASAAQPAVPQPTRAQQPPSTAPPSPSISQPNPSGVSTPSVSQPSSSSSADRPQVPPVTPPPVTRPQAPEGSPPPAADPTAQPNAARLEQPPPSAPTGSSLSGRWVYSPASKSGSPFPPESVTLVMTEAYGQVRGILAGRYRVPKNRKFNPKVNFNFEGVVHPSSSKFRFSAQDGMRGEIEVIRLPGKQDALEVVWYSERDKLTFDDIFFRVP